MILSPSLHLSTQHMTESEDVEHVRNNTNDKTNKVTCPLAKVILFAAFRLHSAAFSY